MSAKGYLHVDAVLPSEEDAKQAVLAAQTINRYLDREEENQPLAVKLGDAATVPLPASAARLLVDVLTNIGDGNAVLVLPMHREVSTQQAADLLNVSRPYLIGMLERRELPFRQVGTRRRVQLEDVLAYKARQAERRRRVLDELTAQAEDLELY
jgi:excisionase family DNA binding protein